jgi:hypothetical protein
MNLGWPIDPAFVEQLATATDAAMADLKQQEPTI